jgi:hypothetical protein
METKGMEMKGMYKLIYVLEKETKELVVAVELCEHEGLAKPFQNVYYGKATVDGQPYDDTMLSCCVNARLAAQRIGITHKEDLIAKHKKEGKRVKIKKEELK